VAVDSHWPLASPPRPTSATDTHHWPVSGIDRRRLRPGRLHDHLAEVSGYIAEVLVGDNQPVSIWTICWLRIDDRDFRTALDQARADVHGVRSPVRNLDAQIALQQPVIEQGTADVAAPTPTCNSRRKNRPVTTG